MADKEMSNLEKAAFNKAIAMCSKLTNDRGFTHTAGLDQYIASEFAKLQRDIEDLKITKKE